MDVLNKIDFYITKKIYDLFNRKYLNKIPRYLGLIPYEIYVLPGMFFAILQVLWLNTPSPIQFHLLPHWFAYSIFQFLKKSIAKWRPGCKYPQLSKYIDESHCNHGHQLQSFPSGHTGVAFSLATALYSELTYPDHPKFFEISMPKNSMRNHILKYSGIFVAIMISIHRISKGYHSFFDVLAGMILGSLIGFISWVTLESFEDKYMKICDTVVDKNIENETIRKECELSKKIHKDTNYGLTNWSLFKGNIGKSSWVWAISKIILSIPIIFLTIKFFVKDFWKLASIKH